jgi:hypothetical protein
MGTLIMIDQDAIHHRESEILSIIVRSYGAALFDFAGLEVCVGYRMAISELKLAVLSLCKKNKLISMRKISGERLYCVPFDVYLKHAAEHSKSIINHLFSVDHIDEDGESAGQDVIMDILILVGLIIKEQPQLGKKGQIDKKLIDVVLSQIRLSSDRIAPYVGKDASKLPYPISVSVLMDLGLRIGIIDFVDDRVSIDEHRLIKWLELSNSDAKLQLYRLWFMVHYPQLRSLRQFLLLIPLLPNQQWFLTGQLLCWVEDHAPEDRGQNDITFRDNMEDLLLCARELGWVETGRTKDGRCVLRSLIGLGKDEQLTVEGLQWFVQPDFEIIVPSGVSYMDHFLMSTYAALSNRDRNYTYRITKETVFSALQQGWSSRDITEHLTSHARFGVPEAIHISLKDWEKQYNGVRMESVTILRCESTGIAEEMMSIPEFNEIINEQSRMKPNIFLVSDNDLNFIKKILSKYGYWAGEKANKKQGKIQLKVPLLMQSSKQAVDQINRYHRYEFEASKGLFHAKIRYDMYTLEQLLPGIESLYPGISEVPSSWLNAYLPYHVYTKKQLLQQAIDWQCYIQTYQDGKDIYLAPIEFVMEGSNLQVAGIYRGERLLLDIINMGAMKLILPGIHDEIKYISTSD